MESSSQKTGQQKGFVTFKMSKMSGNKDQYLEKEKTPIKFSAIKIPDHVRQQMSQMSKGSIVTLSKAPSPSKGSKEYRSAADKLRAELAELKRKREMLSSQSNL